MACTISTSNTPDQIWMIRNSIFRWLNRILRQQVPDDDELIEVMETAESHGGLSLDSMANENPKLCDRLTKRLRSVSDEIQNGKHRLTDDEGCPWPELQEECQSSFGELQTILSNWEKAMSEQFMDVNLPSALRSLAPSSPQ